MYHVLWKEQFGCQFLNNNSRMIFYKAWDKRLSSFKLEQPSSHSSYIRLCGVISASVYCAYRPINGSQTLDSDPWAASLAYVLAERATGNITHLVIFRSHFLWSWNRTVIMPVKYILLNFTNSFGFANWPTHLLKQPVNVACLIVFISPIIGFFWLTPSLTKSELEWCNSGQRGMDG